MVTAIKHIKRTHIYRYRGIDLTLNYIEPHMRTKYISYMCDLEILIKMILKKSRIQIEPGQQRTVEYNVTHT